MLQWFANLSFRRKIALPILLLAVLLLLVGALGVHGIAQLNESNQRLGKRFLPGIALLLNAGQNALTAEELENLCTVMAQRLSILHGLNAPEFFDKSLFRHFIQTLLDLRVLRKDEAGKLSYHELLGELAEGAAKRVLPAEIRLSIRQVALERPAEEAAAESNDAAAN